MILEKVKHTKYSTLRSTSISSQGSIKRGRSQELNDSDRLSYRPRTSGISVKFCLLTNFSPLTYLLITCSQLAYYLPNTY